MPKPKSKIDVDDFTIIEIKASQIGRIIEYDLLIKKCIEKNNHITEDLFNRFIGIIFGAGNDHQEEEKLISSIKKDLLSFVKKPRYDFDFIFEVEIKENDIPNEHGISKEHTSTRILSFENMITEALSGTIWSYSKYKTKLQFIRRCYEIMDRYTKLDNRIRKKYSHRKLTIVTAYITYKLGTYKLSQALKECKENKSEPTNAELYQWLDDSLHTVKTYRPKKR